MELIGQMFDRESKDILEILQRSSQGLSVKQLVERCKNSNVFAERTDSDEAFRKAVERRLIKLANDPRVSIEILEGRPKIYRLGKDFQMPIELNKSIAYSIVLANRLANEIIPTSLSDDLSQYFNEAEMFLSKNGALKYGNLVKNIGVHPEGFGNRLFKSEFLRKELLHQVTEGLLLNQKISFTYLNRYNEDNSGPRVVDPCGIVLRDQLVYLVGYPDNGNNYRHYNLARISGSVELLDELAPKGKAFDLQSYLDKGAFEANRYKEVAEETVELSINKYIYDLLTERFPGVETVSEDTDCDEYVVRFNVKIYSDLVWWLLSLGTNVEVLKPESLRQKMKKTIAEMHSFYEDE